MTPAVDVLVPTYRRPAALAVTLTALAAQTLPGFRVVVSDQTEDGDPCRAGEVLAVERLLRAQGRPVELHRHLPRRGLAEQRQFLLDQARAPYALFLDDDVILAPDTLRRLLAAIRRERCGFVGCGLIGLSFQADERPDEQAIEFWDGPVAPEVVLPGTAAWRRHRLHNAANLHHLRRRLALPPGEERVYRVAWVGGCVLYDVAALRSVGGFGFWRDLPAEHCGEDVLAQLRVMARYGGCGLFPSGAYHQELPTTIADRRVDAPWALPLHEDDRAPHRAVA
jgi:GT2 family glycosyltransferase